MFKVSEEEAENHLKVMNMIFNKDSKGNFLIEDLVREHKQWEYNQRWMRSIFNLVKKRKPIKDKEETADKHKVIFYSTLRVKAIFYKILFQHQYP